jgi:hypothetical protein
MCRRRSRLPWAHSQGGHPREWPPGEVRHSLQAGRRAARRWPNPTEHNEHPTPPQGGEPERRRDERRTRRQAGVSEKQAQGLCTSPRKETPMIPVATTTTELRTWHWCSGKANISTSQRDQLESSRIQQDQMKRNIQQNRSTKISLEPIASSQAHHHRSRVFSLGSPTLPWLGTKETLRSVSLFSRC